MIWTVIEPFVLGAAFVLVLVVPFCLAVRNA